MSVLKFKLTFGSDEIYARRNGEMTRSASTPATVFKKPAAIAPTLSPAPSVRPPLHRRAPAAPTRTARLNDVDSYMQTVRNLAQESDKLSRWWAAQSPAARASQEFKNYLARRLRHIETKHNEALINRAQSYGRRKCGR